jgi:hypothetical protein
MVKKFAAIRVNYSQTDFSLWYRINLIVDGQDIHRYCVNSGYICTLWDIVYGGKLQWGANIVDWLYSACVSYQSITSNSWPCWALIGACAYFDMPRVHHKICMKNVIGSWLYVTMSGVRFGGHTWTIDKKCTFYKFHKGLLWTPNAKSLVSYVSNIYV